MTAHRHSRAVLGWAAIFFVHALIVFAILLAFTGCTRAKAKSPRTKAAAGNVTLIQSGDAQNPATAASNTSTTVIIVPEGGTFVFDDKLGTFTATMTGPATVRVETRADTATAAAAFTPPAPPAPPTASEKTDARVRIGLWIGLVGGVALAGLGIGWGGNLVTIGGACVAGASAFGIFVQDNAWVLTVTGIGVVLAGGGFAVWHLWLKHRQPAPAAPLAPVPFPAS